METSELSIFDTPLHAHVSSQFRATCVRAMPTRRGSIRGRRLDAVACTDLLSRLASAAANIKGDELVAFPQCRRTTAEPALEDPMSSPTPDETVQQHLESRLLELPAELRNDIYRFALVGDPEDKIKITPGMPNPPYEPALLRVNRQARSEASSIYYQENHFRFDMPNFDASAYITWVRAEPIVRSRLQVWFKLQVITSCDVAWENLVRWLEAIHNREVFHGPSSRALEGKRRHRVVAGELKELAGSMKTQGLSWFGIAANLEYSKRMLAAAGDMWL